MIVPWLQNAWDSLQQRLQQENFPHALLLSGAEGIGKAAFAGHLAKSLLCESAVDAQACGQCRSCQQFAAGLHPDYAALTLEESSQNIKIDQVREVIANVYLASHYGRYRVIIINPADRLNRAAANSLLKTLEEPPANTLLILLTSQPASLLATIRSRCQHLALPVPSISQSLDWLRQHNDSLDMTQARLLLALAHGSPYKVQQWFESDYLTQRNAYFHDFLTISQQQGDAVAVVQSWLKRDQSQLLACFYTWVIDVIKLKLAQVESIINQDKLADLQRLSINTDVKDLYQLLDKVTEALKLSRTSLNNQLLLEDIVLYCQDIFLKKQRVISNG